MSTPFIPAPLPEDLPKKVPTPLPEDCPKAPLPADGPKKVHFAPPHC